MLTLYSAVIHHFCVSGQSNQQAHISPTQPGGLSDIGNPMPFKGSKAGRYEIWRNCRPYIHISYINIIYHILILIYIYIYIPFHENMMHQRNQIDIVPSADPQIRRILCKWHVNYIPNTYGYMDSIIVWNCWTWFWVSLVSDFQLSIQHSSKHMDSSINQEQWTEIKCH